MQLGCRRIGTAYTQGRHVRALRAPEPPTIAFCNTKCDAVICKMDKAKQIIEKGIIQRSRDCSKGDSTW